MDEVSPVRQSVDGADVYRGTSLIRNSAPPVPYSRNMPRALWWSLGGWLFLMSEVPLYASACLHGSTLRERSCKKTSLTRTRTHPGPYRRPMPRVLGGS